MSVLSGGTWLIDVYGADPQAPSGLGSSAAIAGLADGGYGAGGFVGTISLNNFGPEDDTATWQADAYINAAPEPPPSHPAPDPQIGALVVDTAMRPGFVLAFLG